MLVPKREPLSFDTSATLALGVIGLGAAVLPLDWFWRGILICVAIALTIYAAQRNSAHPVIRVPVAIVVIILFVGLGAPPVWEDFHANHPTVVFSERIMGLLQPYTITKPPPPPSPQKPKTLEATWGAGRYICKANGSIPTKAGAETNASDFKSYIESWAVVHEHKTPVVTPVPGGNKAELVPLTGSTPSKRTFQVVWVGKELTGTYSADYWPVYAGQPMIPNSQLETWIHKLIEGLANVEPGDCNLQ